MPPSGSTLIHPHLQVFSSSSAPNLMRQELNASQHYLESHRSNFWDDLVAAEKKSGERYLGKIGRTHWMTAFAPMGVAGDVLAVVEDVRSTLELSDQDLLDVAAGLAKAMVEYDQMGIYSFNMNFSPERKPTTTPVSPALPPHLLQPEIGNPDMAPCATCLMKPCAWPIRRRSTKC
jgi:galactose-1-phosphate uridylyltransferase